MKWPMEGAGATALCGFDIGLPKGLTPMVGAASPDGAVFGASPSFPVALGSTRGLGRGPTGVGLCRQKQTFKVMPGTKSKTALLTRMCSSEELVPISAGQLQGNSACSVQDITLDTANCSLLSGL